MQANNEEAKREKNWYPIMYYSRLLTETERILPLHESEILSVFATIRAIKHFLIERHFELVTDNLSITFIKTSNHLPPKLASNIFIQLI